MKRIVSVLLILVLVLSLGTVGCSSQTSNDKTEVEDKEQSNEENNEEPKDSGEEEKEINLQSGNLDWVLDYMHEDILKLRQDLKEAVYQNDEYGQLVEYENDNYVLYFNTPDKYLLKEYAEDYKNAGITGDTIISISLNLPFDLYDDANETIIRYPEVHVGGIGFGMEEDTADKEVIRNEEYYLDYYGNTVYSENKITNINIQSKIQEDVLNGKYAPIFEIKPLDADTVVKIIDIGGTRDEIISILGTDYEEETYEDQAIGGFYTNLTYGDVIVNINEENDRVEYLGIRTNKVTGNFDIHVGDSAVDALKYCEENFEKVLNPHAIDAEDQYLFGIFEFRQGVCLQLVFNRYGTIHSKEDVKEDTVVQGVHIFYMDRVWGV